MKVIVISEFYDLKEDKLRNVGEPFEVSNARFDEIVKNGGEWIEETNEVDPEGEEANKTIEAETEEANKEKSEVEDANKEKSEVEDVKAEEVDNKAKKNTTTKAGAKSDGGRTKKA